MRSAYPTKPEMQPTIVTMIYYGKGINIPFDTQVFDSKDEIAIYQQHCGGENLLVYSGLHEAGDKFSFRSKRHKEFPFSVSIYINGTYDCRISTCCEYRHSLNVRIGGKTGRFGITNVTGEHPCVKCLLEKSTKPPKKESIDTKVKEDKKKRDDEQKRIQSHLATTTITSLTMMTQSQKANKIKNTNGSFKFIQSPKRYLEDIRLSHTNCSFKIVRFDSEIFKIFFRSFPASSSRSGGLFARWCGKRVARLRLINDWAKII